MENFILCTVNIPKIMIGIIWSWWKLLLPLHSHFSPRRFKITIRYIVAVGYNKHQHTFLLKEFKILKINGHLNQQVQAEFMFLSFEGESTIERRKDLKKNKQTRENRK